ncbi:MAG: O-antigen ligase family protein, partial [Planctomycetota bacterium]|nr:O-antigen ligase family protein [Planctomycetota bacterium]
MAKLLRRLVTAIAVTTCLAAGLYAGALVLSREYCETVYTGTFGTRLLFAATAFRMALARPLLGQGLGTFAARSVYYERDADFLHGQRGDVVYSAHSEPAQVAAEMGLPGLALWLVWNFWPFCHLLRSGRQTAASPGTPFSFIIAAAAFGGMFIDSCGSMALRYLELPWHYAAAAALAWTWLAPRPRAALALAMPRAYRRAAAAALAAAACLYVYTVIYPAAQAQRLFQACLAQWQSEAERGKSAARSQQILS